MRFPRLSAALAIAVLMPAPCHADETSALASIKELGGIATPSTSGGWEVAFHLSGRDLTDAKLAGLGELENVVTLNLRDTQITGSGLSHLKELTSLRRLHLERTAVDDAGVAHLAALRNLQYLNLYSTKITDKTLNHLKRLGNLEQLYVWQTDVTDEGVAELQNALPSLKIVRGVDLSKVVAVEEETAEPKVDLTWIPVSGEEPPKSKPGDFITVTFENKRAAKVKLYWVEYGGGLKLYGEIEPGANRLQTTYSGASWVITDESEIPLGYFRTGAEIARAIIPKDL